MKVSAEISEPKTSPISRLNNVKALQDKIDEEVLKTALAIITATAQKVPTDEGTLKNSYHVHHGKMGVTIMEGGKKPINFLSKPNDKTTAVVGSVLEYAGVIEHGFQGSQSVRTHQRKHKSGTVHTVSAHVRSVNRQGDKSFSTSYAAEISGFPQRIATIVKNYLDGK